MYGVPLLFWVITQATFFPRNYPAAFGGGMISITALIA
jgi:hypothetical protein